MSHKIFFQKIEKGKAYFKDEENRTIILPDSYAMEGASEGDESFIEISKKDKLAKDILNEILDIEK